MELEPIDAANTYLFGATSILGWNLVRLDTGRALTPFCNPYVKQNGGRRMRRLRIERAEELAALFDKERPEVLIHCGGICDVAKCEANPDWAYEINVRSVERLLNVLPAGTRLVYCSSDHVFSDSAHPCRESDAPSPISVYGRTRVEAERMILAARDEALVLRSSLAIGPSFHGKTGHLDWLAYRAGKNLEMTIIHDEFRSAVWVEDLVPRVLDFVRSPVRGLRHIPATRAVSREELARYLNDTRGLNARFVTRSRSDLDVPHPGRIELGTDYEDDLASPLPSVVEKLCEESLLSRG
jgi:dTDP-4-dehydrorhamnose reductase